MATRCRLKAYSQHLSSISHSAAPLTDLQLKTSPYFWTQDPLLSNSSHSHFLYYTHTARNSAHSQKRPVKWDAFSTAHLKEIQTRTIKTNSSFFFQKKCRGKWMLGVIIILITQSKKTCQFNNMASIHICGLRAIKIIQNKQKIQKWLEWSWTHVFQFYIIYHPKLFLQLNEIAYP